MSNFIKNIPYTRAIFRLLKNLRKILGLLDSDNYRFISTFQPGHFYSTIPDYSDVINDSGSLIKRSVNEIPGINLNTQYQLKLIKEFSRFYDEMPFPEYKSTYARFWLDNDLFSYGDPVILYSIMRYFMPKRIIEIGSGFSSAAMLDVNDKFFNSEIDFIFIEPYPDRLHGLLEDGDKVKHQIYAQKIQETPLSIFANLEENDILFVDSSHVVKSGSDLLYILSVITPLLNKGVLLHFHDIFWPFEYPDEWYIDGRAWNEAFFLKAFLQFNYAFDIVYFNSQMKHQYTDLLKTYLPITLSIPTNTPYIQNNSSLWLRKFR